MAVIADNDLLKLIAEYIGKETRRSIADKLGVSESMMHLMMKGRRAWTPKYIRIFSEHMGLNPSETKQLYVLAAKNAGYLV